jgi:hypothetical protein
LLSLRVVSLGEWVTIPNINEHINDDGVFVPGERGIAASTLMLGQLVRWTKGMKAIREDK